MNYLLGAPHVMTVTDMNIYMQKFNEDQSTAILKIPEEVRGKGEQFVIMIKARYHTSNGEDRGERWCGFDCSTLCPLLVSNESS